MLIITPAVKDKVLFFLCENATPEQLSSANTTDILKELELGFGIFNAIMVQFQRFGLIEDLNLRRDFINFILLTDAYDYAQKGGFIDQEGIFKSNIEKLLLEVDNLKKQLSPNQLESANKISAVASSIFSELSLFK